ncbi:MAG: hypothetical protein OYH77_01630 [Pseudomonadota bacterium]|nr:hypothetical protein [Pseudomonadota bacterium]
MIFSRQDFQVNSLAELLEFLPIMVFVGLIAPFLLAAYTLGFVMDIFGCIED